MGGHLPWPVGWEREREREREREKQTDRDAATTVTTVITMEIWLIIIEIWLTIVVITAIIITEIWLMIVIVAGGSRPMGKKSRSGEQCCWIIVTSLHQPLPLCNNRFLHLSFCLKFLCPDQLWKVGSLHSEWTQERNIPGSMPSKVFQTSLSAATFSSSSGGILRHSKAKDM